MKFTLSYSTQKRPVLKVEDTDLLLFYFKKRGSWLELTSGVPAHNLISACLEDEFKKLKSTKRKPAYE